LRICAWLLRFIQDTTCGVGGANRAAQREFTENGRTRGECLIIS